MTAKVMERKGGNGVEVKQTAVCNSVRSGRQRGVSVDSRTDE